MQNINFIYNSNKIFHIYIYVPSGSVYESEKERGISHMLEHMVMKHTKEYTEKELLKEMMVVGGSYNAITEKDMTCYYYRTHMDNYKKVTDIMRDVIKNPVFNKNEFQVEKNVVLEELQKHNDIENRLYTISLSTILNNNNAYVNNVGGEPESVSKLTLASLKRYFNERYKDVVVLVNCDESRKGEVKRHVFSRFGKPKPININSLKDVYSLNATSFVSKIVVINNKNTNQYITYINFLSFSKSMVKENTILNFIRYVLISSGLNSILLYELRAKRGLVYSIASENKPYRYLGLLTMMVATSNKNTSRILSVIFDIMLKLQRKGLSKKSLGLYKQGYLNQKNYDFTNDKYRTMWHGFNAFYENNVSQDELIDIIKNITNEEIIEISRRVFDYEHVGVLSYGNYKNAETIERRIYDLFSSYQRVSR